MNRHVVANWLLNISTKSGKATIVIRCAIFVHGRAHSSVEGIVKRKRQKLSNFCKRTRSNGSHRWNWWNNCPSKRWSKSIFNDWFCTWLWKNIWRKISTSLRTIPSVMWWRDLVPRMSMIPIVKSSSIWSRRAKSEPQSRQKPRTEWSWRRNPWHQRLLPVCWIVTFFQRFRSHSSDSSLLNESSESELCVLLIVLFSRSSS